MLLIGWDNSMTDKDTCNEIDIDVARIAELIRQYQNIDSRSERRKIENQVLHQTVWNSSLETTGSQLRLNQDQVETVYQQLPEDAQEAKRILRSLLFETDGTL